MECDGEEEVFPKSAQNSKCTANREIDSDSDVEEVFPTALNPKSSTTPEIDSDSDVEEVFPSAAPSSRSPATREIDPDSDAEEVIPNAKRILSDDGKRLFRVRRTVLEMLRDRGYLVSNADLIRSPEQFGATFGNEPSRENMKICTAKISNPDDRILVIFAKPTDKDKVGKPAISEYVVDMTVNDTRRAILVVQNPLTPIAKKCVDTLDRPYKMEVFQETELIVNLMESVFVPKHQILLPEEKKALMEKYKISEQQLPMLQQTDPVARYLGLEKGQVVRIIRPGDPSAQHQARYRIVT